VSDVTGLQTALDGKQAAGTYATLVNNQVPSANLPSFVDDVIEYANLAAFTEQSTGKIFVARDTGKIYRWSGSAYVEISPSPGSTDSVTEGSTNLYYTNARAAAAAPVQSVAGRSGAVTLTKSDVGLSNVPNTDATARSSHTGTQTVSTISDFATEAAKYGPVASVAGRTGTVTLAKADVGLGNVDNTADASKPISTATQAALDGKAATSHTHSLSSLTQSSATTGQVVAWNGTAWAAATPSGGSSSYTLPTASDTVLGGIRVGSGLTITDGVLAATGGGGSASISGSVTIPARDPYYSQVALLLHMEGAHNSTTFTDSGPSQRTVTRQATAVIKTDQYKFGASSAYFDGADDRLQVALPALGTGDFTVEAWARLDSGNNTYRHIFDSHDGNTPGFAIGVDDSSRAYTFANGFLVQAGTVSANTWTHFAVSRNGGSLRMFLNGTQIGSTVSYTEDIPAMSAATIGGWGARSNPYDWQGYLDEFRLTAGIGRYTANFTPATAAFPQTLPEAEITIPVTVTGTGLTWSSVPATPTATGSAGSIAYDGSYLYLCQATNSWGRAPVSWDSSFSSVASLLQFDLAFPTDAAGNTWTTSGSPTMSRAGGKFGGAIVFPNSPASYITTARTSELEIGSSDFTLEWWLYATAYPAGSSPQFNSLLYSTRGTSALAGFIAVMNPAGKLSTFISSNTSSWDISSGTLFTTSAIPLNQWTHVALTRSGTTYKGFFNGTLEVTATLSGTPSVGSGGVFIGGDTGGERFVGLMDEFRFTKSCRYTASFTPPTAPFANR
jgi:hypothetical protein